MPLDDTTFTSFDDNDGDGARSVATKQIKLLRWIRSKNIADEPDFDIAELPKIGQKVIREYEIDYNSCNEWRVQYKEHLKFALQVAEEKTYPWPGASNIIYPLLTIAAIQFAARAYPAIINGPHVVKGIVIGNDNGVPLINPQTKQPVVGPQGPIFIVQPGAKRDRADNVADHMSWQLLYEEKEWESDTDRLLHILPITGCCFRKTWFDPGLGRNCSSLITADKLVINYYAKSFESAPRYSEELILYPIELEENIRAGLFIDQDYPRDGAGETHKDPGDDDAPIEFIEQHRRLDLDEDGYAEPYIVTVQKSTNKVARIVAAFEEAGVLYDPRRNHEIVRITPVTYYTRYIFLPSSDPDGCVYGMGLGKLLLPINEAINTTLNQMVDAGHLQIRGGGFIGKSLSMNTGNVRFAMGEYKAVNISGTTLRENLVPLTFPGPNAVLFQLLGLLIESGKEVAAVKDVLSGDVQNANVPATTTIALIEQGLKVFTAIYKRVYRALKDEFEKIYRLNSIYLAEKSNYNKGDEWRQIERQDYNKSSGIEPVADPSVVSDMQRLSYAQFLLQFAGNPSFNNHEIYTTVFDYARIPNPSKYILTQPQPNPAILAKISEVSSRTARDRASETRDIAQSILFLAQARKVSDDAHLAWFDQQLEMFRTQFEQSQSPDGSGQPPPQQGPQNQPNQQQGPPPPGQQGPMPEGAFGPVGRELLGASGINLPQLTHMPPTFSGAPPSVLAQAGPGGSLPPNALASRFGNNPYIHR
jgi:chaperonin GroES